MATPKPIAKIESEPPSLRFAVLIDADNAQALAIDGLLAEVARYGEATVRRIHGDFTSQASSQWKKVLNKHSSKPFEQFAYTAGKSATDSMLVIDAMDLLYTRRFDGFCRVSSDSDFTGLAMRIREEGLTVLGFGEQKTPESFRNACPKFIYTEVLRPLVEQATSGASVPSTRPEAEFPLAVPAPENSKRPIPAEFILQALDKSGDDTGWGNLAALGNILTKLQSEFDPRLYEYRKLSDLVRALPDLFRTGRASGTGLEPQCLVHPGDAGAAGKPVTITARSGKGAQRRGINRFARVHLISAALILAWAPVFAADPNYPFSVQTEKSGDGHIVVGRNRGPAPVSVRVSIPDSNNIETDRSFPVHAVVPPGGEAYLGQVHAGIRGMGYTFRTQANWVLGDFNAEQHPQAIYRLPFRDGEAYLLGQSPGGPITTHNTAENAFAVDLQLPEGTPVVASREGTVIETEAGQTYGGQDPDLLPKANCVRILHQDGTIATYAHLAHGGVFVYPGQHVAEGTEIGLAGNTGFSSGPHLHFVVQKIERSGDAFAAVSVPFKFSVGNPPATFSPAFGMFARADYASPGQIPDFGMPRAVRRSPVTTQSSAAESSGLTQGQRPEIYLDVPEPVRRFLQGVPVWQWGILLIAVWVVLVLLKARSRPHREPARAEPTLTLHDSMPLAARPRVLPDVLRTELSPTDRLVVACASDRRQAEMLLAQEIAQSPSISESEAAQRALTRLIVTRRRMKP
jgi:murein DD-endopeptidase MepM/ murein hydrolase activator NlpD